MRTKLLRLKLIMALGVVIGSIVSTGHCAKSLTIGEYNTLPGSALRVPVTMPDATGVAAVAFIVNFDNDLLGLTNVTNGNLGATFGMKYKLEEGRVHVALVRDDALTTGSGTLVELQFTVNRGAAPGMTTPLTIADGTVSGQSAVDFSWTEGISFSNGLVRIVAGLEPDADGDGLPDWWEMLYFGDLTGAEVWVDSDGDGVRNWNEYVAGTHPLQRESALRLEWPARLGLTGLILRFEAQANRPYVIEYLSRLGETNWMTLQTVPAAPSNRWVELQQPISAVMRYYRIGTPGPQ